MLSIAFVLGTRPEIIKLAPVIKEVESRKISYTIIHTGQHYDDNLSVQIFESLGVRLPDYNLDIKTKVPHNQLGEMIEKLGELYLKVQPSIVLSVGDTVSVLASSLACVQNNIPYGHIEAGLRSFDFTMPEEINRRLVDQISSVLFAPSERAVINLNNEGIETKRIHQTGNTIIDSARIFSTSLNEKSTESANKILEEAKDTFILATIHRVANVENRNNLEEIVKAFKEYTDHPIVFLAHPRTMKKLEEFALIQILKQNKKLYLHPPIEYLSLLRLLKSHKCLLLITDSGGLQEEASYLRKPCLTIRSNTERPETIKCGASMLSGIHILKPLECVKIMLNGNRNWEIPSEYLDLNVSDKIIKYLLQKNYE